MMRLDHERLAALENEFKQNEEGLELPNFIWLLQCAISHPDDEKFELVRGLIKLFKDIDINGDENVEWSEFTQYIIDAVVTRADDTQIEEKKEVEDDDQNEDYETQKAKIEKAYVQGAKEYVIDEDIGSNLVFLNSVEKMIYSSLIKKLIILESQSQKLKFYNLSLSQYELISLEAFQKTRRMNSFIIDFDICEDEDRISDLEMLVTCSLDGYIKFWDIRKNELISKSEQPQSSLENVGNGKSSKGIIGMAYSELQDHYIVAWGFSFVITIWNPFLSQTRPFCNTYSNHNGVIKYAQLMNHTSSCVSIDSKYCLRIWDIRTLETAQVILIENVISVVTNILVLRNDSFLIAGKKIRYVLNKEAESKIKFLDTAYPIFAEFNSYFKRLIIVTKFDMRIYDPMKGSLYDVYTGILPKSKDMLSYVMSYSDGPRERKFYIGDNTGHIRQYNTDNAHLIKIVNDLKNEKYQISDYLRKVSMEKLTNKGEYSDITCILYLPDDAVLIVGTSDSMIKFYDEGGDAEDEGNLIKFYIGGHIDSEITALAYNGNQGLLASGSMNGIVTLWDVINTKMEFTFRAHWKKITKLQFGINFPVLIVASLDGSITVWGHKPADFKFKHKCIIRLMVFDYEVVTMKRTDFMAGVTDVHCSFEFGKLRYPKKYKNKYLKKEIGTRKEAFDGFYVKKTGRKGLFFKSKIPGLVRTAEEDSYREEVIKIKKKLAETKEEEREANFFSTPFHLLIPISKKRNRNKKTPAVLRPIRKLKEEFSKDPEISHKQEISMNKFLELNNEMYKDRYNPSSHLYIYFSTVKGDLHVCDLGSYLNFLELSELKITPNNEREDKLRRQESLAVCKQVKAAINSQMSSKRSLWPTYDYFLSLHNFSVLRAHTGKVTLFQYNKNQKIFLSGGKDSKLKIWNHSLELLGNIDVCEPSNTVWNYSIDWINVFLEEFDEVFENMQIIEGRTYDENQREKIINNFLEKYYKNPALRSKKIKNEIPRSELTRKFYTKYSNDIKSMMEKINSKFKVLNAENPLEKVLKLPILHNYELTNVDKKNLNGNSRMAHQMMRKLEEEELKMISSESLLTNTDFLKTFISNQKSNISSRRRQVKKKMSTDRKLVAPKKKLLLNDFKIKKKNENKERKFSVKKSYRSRSRRRRKRAKIKRSDSEKIVSQVGTDLFIDDFTRFNMKNSKLPEFRVRQKKKVDHPVSMVDYVNKTTKNYSNFMEKLTESYAELGTRYKMKYKGKSSRILRQANNPSLYSKIKNRHNKI